MRIVPATLAFTLLCGCASNRERSCEDLFARCEKLCEKTESKGFHGPMHLPPPITKGPRTCREGCSDERQSCEVMLSQEITHLITCTSETYLDYSSCDTKARHQCPKGYDDVARGSSYSKVGGVYDMHLQVRCQEGS